jgi:hypothetical protein
MKTRICFNCVHRIVDIEDAKRADRAVQQWQCKKEYWQDMTISLYCHPQNRDWAERCKHFEMIIEV